MILLTVHTRSSSSPTNYKQIELYNVKYHFPPKNMCEWGVGTYKKKLESQNMSLALFSPRCNFKGL